MLADAKEALTAAKTPEDERQAARDAASALTTAAGLARIEPFGSPAATVFATYAREVRLAAELAGLDALVHHLRPAFNDAIADLEAAAAKLPDDNPLDAAAALERDDVETIAARNALRRLAALTPRQPTTRTRPLRPRGRSSRRSSSTKRNPARRPWSASRTETRSGRARLST